MKLSDIAGEKRLILRLDSGYGSDRNIVVRTLTKKGDFEYTMLISNIPSFKKSAKKLYYFYNKRQTIEAFFKTLKNTYHIKTLELLNLWGIQLPVDCFHSP